MIAVEKAIFTVTIRIVGTGEELEEEKLRSFDLKLGIENRISPRAKTYDIILAKFTMISLDLQN